MLKPELITLFVEPLERHGVIHFISGSVASIIYGEPRATMDIDLGIFINDGNYALIREIFPESEFYVPPVEVIALESKRQVRGHYNIIHHESGFKADFYPSRNHPLLPWALRNVRKVPYGEIEIRLAPPEYVILWKLAFYQEGKSEKHLRDIKGIIQAQEDRLNLKLLEETVTGLHLQDEWTLANN